MVRLLSDYTIDRYWEYVRDETKPLAERRMVANLLRERVGLLRDRQELWEKAYEGRAA